jgi:hypothetical protein
MKCPSEITGHIAIHRWMPSDPTVNNPATIFLPWTYHGIALSQCVGSLLKNNAMYTIDNALYIICRVIPW